MGKHKCQTQQKNAHVWKPTLGSSPLLSTTTHHFHRGAGTRLRHRHPGSREGQRLGKGREGLGQGGGGLVENPTSSPPWESDQLLLTI